MRAMYVSMHVHGCAGDAPAASAAVAAAGLVGAAAGGEGVLDDGLDEGGLVLGCDDAVRVVGVVEMWRGLEGGMGWTGSIQSKRGLRMGIA